jgi:hypothetical protein
LTVAIADAHPGALKPSSAERRCARAGSKPCAVTAAEIAANGSAERVGMTRRCFPVVVIARDARAWGDGARASGGALE